MHFIFGDHVLDPARRELRRGAELIEVEPQVFDLLLHLIRNRHRVDLPGSDRRKRPHRQT